MLGFAIFAVALLLLCFLYVRGMARSRRSMDQLNTPPDDMKRAGDTQQPPFDGSSGWV